MIFFIKKLLYTVSCLIIYKDVKHQITFTVANLVKIKTVIEMHICKRFCEEAYFLSYMNDFKTKKCLYCVNINKVYLDVLYIFQQICNFNNCILVCCIDLSNLILIYLIILKMYLFITFLIDFLSFPTIIIFNNL